MNFWVKESVTGHSQGELFINTNNSFSLIDCLAGIWFVVFCYTQLFIILNKRLAI